MDELLDSLNQALFYLDEANKILSCNETATQFVSMPRSELEGRCIENFFELSNDIFDDNAADATTTEWVGGRLQHTGYPSRSILVKLAQSPEDNEATKILTCIDTTAETIRRETTHDNFVSILQQIFDAIGDTEQTFDEKIDLILEQLSRHLDCSLGVVSKIDDSTYTLRYIFQTGDHFEPGDTLNLYDVTCVKTVEKGKLHAFTTNKSQRVDFSFQKTMSRPGTYIGIPLRIDDELYGTLSFFDATPRSEPFSLEEKTLIRQVANWIESKIDAFRANRIAVRLRQMIEAFPSIVGIATPDGRIRYINQAGRKLTGWSGKTDSEQTHLTDLYPEWASRIIREEAIPKAIEEGVWTGESAILDQQGRQIPTFQTLVAHFDQNGEFSLLSTITQDISQLKKRKEQLEKSRQLLRQVLHTIPNPVVAKDQSGEFLFANQSFAQFYDRDKDSVLGDTDAEVMPDNEAKTVRNDDLEVLESGEPISIDEERLTDSSGQSRVFETRKIPFQPVMSDERAVLSVRTEITERRKKNHRLRQMGRLARVGAWELELNCNSLTWTDQVYRIHGLDPDSDVDIETMLRMYTDSSADKLNEALDTARREGAPFDLELEMAERRGRTRWIRIMARPEFYRDDVIRLHGAIQDITERKRVEKLKDEFVSVVSHELRTPLTSLRGALGLVAGGATGQIDEDAEEMIEMAQKNSERLSNLINDILDVEKIERGEININTEPIDPRAIVEEVVKSMRSYATDKEVTLATHFERGLDQVRADPDRLHQVLTNLIGNAVKYSPDDGVVVIRVERQTDKNTTLFSVRDFGPGIPEAFRDRLFEKFSQFDSSDTRSEEGTGLGLSIARALTERMNGEIEFETEKGEGTIFYVELPRADTDSQHTSARLPADHLTEGRVLVVEDDPDVAEVLCRSLEARGADVEVAPTAQKALEYAANKQFDAATVDLILPDSDGFQLIHKLHNLRGTNHMNMVIVSARAGEARQQLDGRLFKVIDWIDKPIGNDRLLNAVDTAIARDASQTPVVLHVEDDSDIVSVTEHIVGDSAQFETVATLEAARKQLSKKSFDLLLLDVYLPDGSGLELLRELESTPNEHTPVIVFSSAELPDRLTQKVATNLVKSRTTNQQLVETIEYFL